MVSRSIVVHWDGAWSAIASQAANLPCTIYRRTTSARTVPFPTLLYPDLTFPALPSCSPLSVCLCFLLCVSYLTYLCPFVSVIVVGMEGPPHCSQ
jgi:hypothetical protein